MALIPWFQLGFNDKKKLNGGRFMPRAIVIALLLEVMAGCADAPPAPAGKDTYIISSSTTWTFKAGGELLPGLYARADAFCHRQGKRSTPVSNTTGDGGIALNANAQLTFRCDPP